MNTKILNLTYVVLLVLSVCTCLVLQDDAPSRVDETGSSWQSQLHEDDLQRLKRMMYGDDIGSSLLAKWTECKLRCNGSTEVAAHAAKHEFVGFLSGKTNSPVPAWWVSYLLSIDPNKLPDLFVEDRTISETFGLSHDSNVKIDILDNKFISGSIDGDKFRFKWLDDVDDETRWRLNDSVEPRDVLAFFALKKLPDGEHLFALSDRFNRVDVVRLSAEGRIFWRSTIEHVESGFKKESNKVRNGRTEIVVDNSEIRVFGVGSDHFFLDVFDFETGKSEYSFDTLR